MCVIRLFKRNIMQTKKGKGIKMNIVFITPASALRRIPLYRWAGKAYGQSNSVTGPLILGGILKQAGHNVAVYEELNANVSIQKLMRSADVFCFSIMTSNAPRGYALADYVHQHSLARVIIGGIHASAMPEEALEHADQVIVGEGESVITDVVEGRRKESVVYCKSIDNLDKIPFPDYSILKTPCKAANIVSTRGCPYRCTFCTTSRMFAPYRQRSVENVISEIRRCKKAGFKYLNFEDDNFTADKERAKEICHRMIKEDLCFKESFFFGRTDLAEDEELLQLLYDAHLTRVLIGIESLNQKALDHIEKRQSIYNIKKAAEACERHGIRVIASVVLGIDEDTAEDMWRSVRFAKEIHAYQLQPAILTPFPGVPLYEKYEKEDRIITHNWSQYDMMNVVFKPKQLKPWALQELFFKAVIYFYDYKSIRDIAEKFGYEYGLRRFWLAVFVRLGNWGAHIAGKFFPSSPYYQLKNEVIPFEYRKKPSCPVHLFHSGGSQKTI